jgi:transcriptional regulator with XRE-family HTH domain
MMSKGIIEPLKEKQQCRGLSQEAMSERLGITQSTLSRLYTGKRDLGMQTLRRIIRVYLGLAVLQYARDSKCRFPTRTLVRPAARAAASAFSAWRTEVRGRSGIRK